MSDFADRFLFRPATPVLDGATGLERVVESADGWDDVWRHPLHELFHKNTKLSSTALARWHVPSEGQVNDYLPAKDYEGYRWVGLPQPPALPPRRDATDPPGSESNGLAHDVLAALAECLYWSSGGSLASKEGRLPPGQRRSSSVGHLYPVDVYLVLLAPELPESGVYYYHSLLHRLYEIRSGRLTGELAKAGLATPMLQRASALVLLTGVFPRNAQRFGNRGYRYTMLEAGMLAERFGQCASQLGLTASCAPEFVDDELNRLLGIDGIDEAVVLGIAVETKLT